GVQTCALPISFSGSRASRTRSLSIALPILPWWNAVAINDVPAQSDFYSSANGRLLNDLVRDALEPEKVALLQKVWRQRLSYRLVRRAEECKITLSGVAETPAPQPVISQ